MIKIIASNKYYCDEITYLINLCKFLNKNGITTEFYAPDLKYAKDNYMKDISEFVPVKNDTVLVYDIPLKTINDLFDLDYILNPPVLKKNKLKYKIKLKLSQNLRQIRKNIAPQKEKNFKLIAVLPSNNKDFFEKSNKNLFDKIIVSSETQNKLNNKFIVIPAIESDIDYQPEKENKIAGIIAPVCEFSNIEKAVQQAMSDGMERINIYGYMKNPVYYNKNLSKLIMNCKGKIKYYGNIDENIIYNTVSDIYDYSEYRTSDLLEKNCKKAHVNLHSNKENKSNEDTDITEFFKELKNIISDFYKMLDLLKNHVPFAFTRYSDGELFILQNKELILESNLIKVGDKNIVGKGYSKEDHKHYNPKEHTFYKDKLIESFQFEKENYFKGIACKCCVTQEDYDWQFNDNNGLKNTQKQNLTWANLLINCNYERFITEMYPVLCGYNTVFICNEKADLSPLPFVVKEYRVGYNAMINDYPQIENIKKWISENNIKGYLFLFAASSFSELAIKELYEYNDKNTYIDIGTALNMFMDMRNDRGYLGEYWNGNLKKMLKKECIW